MLGVSSIASRIPRSGSMVMTNAVGKGGETSHDFHQGLHQDPASGSSSVALALASALLLYSDLRVKLRLLFLLHFLSRIV